jgi:hypothetical protein
MLLPVRRFNAERAMTSLSGLCRPSIHRSCLHARATPRRSSTGSPRRGLWTNDGAPLAAVNSSLVLRRPISATALNLCASASDDGSGSRQSDEAIPTTSRTRCRPSARGQNEILPTGQRIGKVTPNMQPAIASINAVATPSAPPPVLQRWMRRIARNSSMMASTNYDR